MEISHRSYGAVVNVHNVWVTKALRAKSFEAGFTCYARGVFSLITLALGASVLLRSRRAAAVENETFELGKSSPHWALFAVPLALPWLVAAIFFGAGAVLLGTGNTLG